MKRAIINQTIFPFLTLALAASTLLMPMAGYAALTTTTTTYYYSSYLFSYKIIDGSTPIQGTGKTSEYSAVCYDVATRILGGSVYSCEGVHQKLLSSVAAGLIPQSFITSGFFERVQFILRTTAPVNTITMANRISADAGSSRFKYAAEPLNSFLRDPIKQVTPSGNTAGTCGGTNDTYFCDQWSIDNSGQAGGIVGADINLLGAPGSPGVWATTQGEGVVVAVLDSGVDYNHPDLAANMWTNTNDPVGDIPDSCDRSNPLIVIALADDDCNGIVDDVRGANFVNVNNDPMDTYGSGTHIAGIIAAVADNGIGIAGIAPKAKIMPIKVSTNMSAPTNLILEKAIAYAILEGADVIVMNFYFNDPQSYYCNEAQDCTATALKLAYESGVVLVASAGSFPTTTNQPTPPNLPMLRRYPAAFGSPARTDQFDVLAVAATTRMDARATNSNFSVRRKLDDDDNNQYGGYWVEIAAPGYDIMSTGTTYNTGAPYKIEQSNMEGAAHVAGVAALLKSADPSLNHEQVKQILLGTSRSFLSPPAVAGTYTPGVSNPTINGFCPQYPNLPSGHMDSRNCDPAQYKYIGGTLDMTNPSDPRYLGGAGGMVDATAAIASLNKPPVWIGVDTSTPPDGTPDSGSVQLHSNKEARFNVLFNDPNGNPLTVTMQAGLGLQHSIFDGTKFSWTANETDMLNPSAMVGYYDLRFTANDGRGGVVQSPLVTISIPTNRAPYFLSDLPGTLQVHVWDLVDFTLNAIDPNKDQVTYHPGYQCITRLTACPVGQECLPDPGATTCSPVPLPTGSTFTDVIINRTKQKRFTWRPLNGPSCVPGACTTPMTQLLFYASDRGPMVFDGNSLLVDDPIINPAARLIDEDGTLVRPTNEAPVIGPPANEMTVNASVGVPLSFTLAATDAHNDAISVAATGGLPQGATFNSGTRTFNWPSPQTPNRDVFFTATDYFDNPADLQRYWGMSSPQYVVHIVFPITETVPPTVNIERPVLYCNVEPPPVDFKASMSDSPGGGLQSYTLRLYRRSGDTADLQYGTGTLMETITSPGLGGVLSYTATWPSHLLGIGYYRYDIEVFDTAMNKNSPDAFKTFKVASSCIG